MWTEGNLMVCTIREFAEYLAEGIDSKVPLESRFRECDFAIHYGKLEGPLDLVEKDASGWYGVKVLPELGFDTDCMILTADYYGGGCAEFCSIYPDYDGYLNPTDAIMDMVLSCVKKQEDAADDTPVFVVKNRYVSGNGRPE